MIDLIIRNLIEYKTRTFLTTLGVIIAIAAIISLCSISEGIQNLAENSVSMIGGLIIVSEAGESLTYSMSSTPYIQSKIDIETKEEIENIEGVERVAPVVFKQFPGGYIVRGIDLKDLDMFHLENLKLKDGGWMKDEEYEVVVGSETAKIHNLEVNDVIKLGNNEFTVIGILEKTDTIVDYATITSLKVAQKAFDINYFSMLIVKPENPDNVEIIKEEIERIYDNLQASTQKDMIKKMEEAISNVRIFTMGIGIITAIVAAIGIFNTISMSVSSRIKDFGIMKGIGAERKTIIYLVVGEGIIIAIIGGVIGI
ncbi:MAG: ABC transporter permease, partial [Candidatus Altarchaeaceae archaeon]